MNLYQKIVNFFVTLIGKIHWSQTSLITDQDRQVIREKLTNDYYIIATRRRNYLSTFFISLGHFFLTGRWGHYSHVLMNLEDTVTTDADFRLIEATSNGTHYSTFSNVFNGVDSVALLKPKNLTLDEWTSIMDKAKEQLGKPYDTLFNVLEDSSLSCVELVRIALMGNPDYYEDFSEFEKLVTETKNLTPQMFLECPDFEIVYEIKR